MLQLNPTLPLDPVRLAPIALTVVLFYAAHLTVFFYACLVLHALLAREPFSPAWISVAALSRLAAASAAAGALLMWLNLRTFALVLPSATVNVMFTGMLMVGASALLFVLISVLRAQFDTRLRRVWALLLAIVAAGSIAAPIAIRGRGVPAAPETRSVDAIGDVADVTSVERSSRVTILAIDAASLELITNATADGRLPNFGRLLDAGAVMHLATLHPTSAEAVWAAAATGKLPQKNGVRSSNDGVDQHRLVGRVDLAVGRWRRHVAGQQAARRVDRGLHVGRGAVDVAVERELQGDRGVAEPAPRRHRHQAGDGGELVLERRGDGCGHGVRAGAGSGRRDRDGREVDVGQGRDRQHRVGGGAEDQQPHHHQRGRDRAAG